MSDTDDLPPDIANAPMAVQQHYREVLGMGYSQRWAEMCALQQPPGTQGTDRAFMEGRYHGGHFDQLPDRQAAWLMKEAKAAGISTRGKVYMSGLADKRGHLDPMAWVDSVDDVKRVAKVRQLEVRGIVNYSPPEGAAPPKRVDMNPKLVRELAKKEMAKTPGLSRAEASRIVKERHSLKRKLD
jgi:hypothetical protein